MSGATSFSSADRIIRLAMMDAGLLQEGDDPSSEQYANYIHRLNDLINFWQTQGLKLWLQHDLAVPLVQGQTTYPLGPGGSVDMTKPMRVLDNGYYLDNHGVKRPLIMISRDEYTRLSQVSQQGAINSYFVDKLRDQLVVYVWPTPDYPAATGGILHLLIQKQVGNVSNITEQMDFPQEWFLALRWGLADDICTGQPATIMARCANRAQVFRDALEAWDVEDAATLFQPDHRIAYVTGAFR